MKDKRIEFINWVNEFFKPTHPGHEVALRRECDGAYLISSENIAHCPGEYEDRVIDYYDEFSRAKGGPYVHPWIPAKLKQMGLRYEWENAGAIIIYED